VIGIGSAITIKSTAVIRAIWSASAAP